MTRRFLSGPNRIDQLRCSWLDFTLGFRMLARSPGLTLVGTLAIAVAIALGTIYFEAVDKWQNPRLPILNGDRVMSSATGRERRGARRTLALRLAIWREQVKTVHTLGAAVVFVRNLAAGDGRVEPVQGAEVTSSAFGLMGTAPLLGRTLTAQDERRVYRPSLPTGRAGSPAVRARDPDAFTTRLRTIAADVDPTMRPTDVQLLTHVGGGEATIHWTLTAVAWLISFIVLLLSATGIHALMSFTVARRTREIGIRAALRATPRPIVAGIFSRAFLQIGAGVIAGSGLAALMGIGSTREVLLLLANGIMLAVGLAACAVPLSRALRIDPADALRAEG